MNKNKGREQRIYLTIQNTRLVLKVDADCEPDYRTAHAELGVRLDCYRDRYPDGADTLPRDTYLAMSALDRAYYLVCERKRNDTAPFLDTIRRLNAEIDRFLSIE